MNWSVWCWIWVLNWRFLIFALLFVEVSEWNQFIVDSNYIKRLVNEYFAMLSKWRNMQRCRFCYNRWKRAASSAGRTSVTRPSSSLQTTTKKLCMYVQKEYSYSHAKSNHIIKICNLLQLFYLKNLLLNKVIPVKFIIYL